MNVKTSMWFKDVFDLFLCNVLLKCVQDMSNLDLIFWVHWSWLRCYAWVSFSRHYKQKGHQIFFMDD